MTAPKLNPSRRPSRVLDALPASAPAVAVLASGVDTLHLFTRASVAPRWRDDLDRLQAEAAARHRHQRDDEGMPVTVGGQTFHVKPHGARTAPFLLDAPEVAAVLVNPGAGGSFPTVTVELRALRLWQDGADAVVRTATEWVRELCGVGEMADDPELHVGRLDLAVDFQGWQPDPVEGHHDPHDETATRYVYRANDFAAHTVTMRAGAFRGRLFSGFMFGRGAVAARLYHKSVEAERSAKLAAMTEVWRASPAYRADVAVWRLEYQLRREAITALRIGDGDAAEVSTWAQLRPSLRGLWVYLSTRWLARRAPRTRTSRQPLSPEWAALSRDGFAGGVWQGAEGDVHRAHREDVAARLTPQLAGYLSRAVAEVVYFAPGRGIGELPDMTLEKALPTIVTRVRDYTESRETSIEAKAEKKVARWDDARADNALGTDLEEAANVLARTADDAEAA